ncbi:unnamed protein product [Meloidogyne enterolobii]|uniref:Uncharacterized protein n=1 Tax=Meloidogyne enterolobii TaxID=390850 RepID=A0ACB1A1K2_MELEN
MVIYFLIALEKNIKGCAQVAIVFSGFFINKNPPPPKKIADFKQKQDESFIVFVVVLIVWWTYIHVYFYFL